MQTNPKSILITGALSDIGRATAVAFAKAGWRVIVNHRTRADDAAQFADELVRVHNAPAALPLQADVRERAQVQAMFARAGEVFGGVDALVNNAGLNRDQPFLEMSDEAWHTVTDTILKGSFICSQEYARQYRGDAGCILNFGATTAITGRKNGANYCPARAGILTLTKCLALELAPRIRVNTVTPGRIDTEEVRQRYHTDDPSSRTAFEAGIPLGSMGQSEDVASMIYYLVTQGTYITGQNFIVDGGVLMH